MPPNFRSSAIAAFHNTYEAVNVQINGYTFPRGEREFPANPRPLSAPFLFPTSGKGTDMATPLGLEKYGRIDFSLGRWTTMGQNAPKLVLKHAKEQVELVRIFLHSLLRPQESLF